VTAHTRRSQDGHDLRQDRPDSTEWRKIKARNRGATSTPTAAAITQRSSIATPCYIGEPHRTISARGRNPYQGQGDEMDPERHTGRATGVLVAAILLALTACSSTLDDAEPPAKPAAKASPAPPITAQQQAEVDKAWASYLKLNEIYLQALQTGSYNWDKDTAKRPLYPYAAGSFLSFLERDVGLMQEKGLVRTGASKVTLRRVVSVSPTSIIVESCVDDSDTDTINKATKKSVAAPNQNKKYPVTLRAGLYPDGLWRWVESYADRASSC
jgi:hypothetical protein